MLVVNDLSVEIVTGWFMRAGAAVRPSAGVVTLALSPFVPAAALLGARFRAESSCLLPDSNGNLDPEAPSPANMGRRRSRAVLYQLSGHYKPDKMKTKLKLNNVSKVNFVNCLTFVVVFILAANTMIKNYIVVCINLRRMNIIRYL